MVFLFRVFSPLFSPRLSLFIALATKILISHLATGRLIPHFAIAAVLLLFIMVAYSICFLHSCLVDQWTPSSANITNPRPSTDRTGDVPLSLIAFGKNLPIHWVQDHSHCSLLSSRLPYLKFRSNVYVISFDRTSTCHRYHSDPFYANHMLHKFKKIVQNK